MDIPDDLEVNTVTASGTVKALNGEFDAVRVKGENVILNQNGITCAGSALVSSLSADGLVLKQNGTPHIQMSTLGNMDTTLRFTNLPKGGANSATIDTLSPGQVFIYTDKPVIDNAFGKCYQLCIKL